MTAVRLKEPTLARLLGGLGIWERAKREGAKHTARLLASICNREGRGSDSYLVIVTHYM